MIIKLINKLEIEKFFFLYYTRYNRILPILKHIRRYTLFIWKQPNKTGLEIGSTVGGAVRCSLQKTQIWKKLVGRRAYWIASKQPHI